MRKVSFAFAVAALIGGLSVAAPALAWKEHKSPDSYSSETAHYVQCNNGDKWEIRVRSSDGAAKAMGGAAGYNYTDLKAAAKAVCKE